MPWGRCDARGAPWLARWAIWLPPLLLLLLLHGDMGMLLLQLLHILCPGCILMAALLWPWAS